MSIEVYLTNLGKYNEGYLIGQFVKLPISETDLEAVLKTIGIDGIEYEEYFITDIETDITGISDIVSEFTSIKTLNELAEALEKLDNNDSEKLLAILESEKLSSITEVLNVISGLDDWSLYVGVDSDRDLGYYYIDELASLNIPENIKPYFDYESYGRDIRLSENSCFTTYGYIVNYS